MFDYAEILDNTATLENYKELGIFKFAKLFFPDRFVDDFAPLHYKMCMQLFKLLDPNVTEAIDRKAYYLVHREAAKTTVGTFLFPIYLIYLKGLSIFVTRGMLGYDTDVDEVIEIPIDERFIVIASATATAAEMFVNNLKNAIEQRGDMKDIFGEKNPRLIETDEENDRVFDKTWRKQMFMTADGTIVRGVGMGQQIRGANIGGSRPTLIITDDIYSEDNNKTEYGRGEVKRWFFNAVENSLDSHKGKILCLGTMMHPDSIFKIFQKNPFWKGVEVPVISTTELNMVLTELREMGKFDDDDWFITPESIAWFRERQKTLTTLSWPERHTLRKIIVKYRDKLLTSDLNWFYQEFMNMAVAPEVRQIQEHSFYRTDVIFYQNEGKQYVRFKFEQAMWYGPVNLYLGIDPASSVSTTSDDTVLTVAGIANCMPQVAGYDAKISMEKLPRRYFPILAHIEGGKYSIYDYEGLPGICEASTKLAKMYKLEAIRIETNGQQAQMARELSRTMKNDRVIEQMNSVSKKERILSIMLSIIQKYKFIICNKRIPYLDKLFIQLLTVGIADHDDYADSVSIAFQDAKEPYGAAFLGDTEQTTTKTRFQRLQELYGDRAWEYL